MDRDGGVRVDNKWKTNVRMKENEKMNKVRTDSNSNSSPLSVSSAISSSSLIVLTKSMGIVEACCV